MITVGKGGVYIDLQVQPNARHPGVRGVFGERLRVAVAAPAVGGMANEATVAAVADLLGVPRGSVSLAAGSKSRRKRVLVQGIDSASAHELIVAALDG